MKSVTSSNRKRAIILSWRVPKNVRSSYVNKFSSNKAVYFPLQLSEGLHKHRRHLQRSQKQQNTDLSNCHIYFSTKYGRKHKYLKMKGMKECRCWPSEQWRRLNLYVATRVSRNYNFSTVIVIAKRGSKNGWNVGHSGWRQWVPPKRRYVRLHDAEDQHQHLARRENLKVMDTAKVEKVISNSQVET
jgi:hypothetical protein